MSTNNNKKKLSHKSINVIYLALAFSGMVFIGSGFILNSMVPTSIDDELKTVDVIQKKVAMDISNDIKLKVITSNINEPISMNVEDYLDLEESLDDDSISQLTLDTSQVNIMQEGTYTYTVTCGNKKYNGEIIIKNLAGTTVSSLTLKDIDIEVNTPLPTELSTYILDSLDNETLRKVILDTSKVNPNIEGMYQYTVSLNNKMYTGLVTVYAPKTNNEVVETIPTEVIPEESTE